MPPRASAAVSSPDDLSLVHGAGRASEIGKGRPDQPPCTPTPALPAFLDRGWLRLTTAEVIARFTAANAALARREARAAAARRRALARGCARALQRDAKRKARARKVRRRAAAKDRAAATAERGNP